MKWSLGLLLSCLFLFASIYCFSILPNAERFPATSTGLDSTDEVEQFRLNFQTSLAPYITIVSPAKFREVAQKLFDEQTHRLPEHIVRELKEKFDSFIPIEKTISSDSFLIKLYDANFRAVSFFTVPLGDSSSFNFSVNDSIHFHLGVSICRVNRATCEMIPTSISLGKDYQVATLRSDNSLYENLAVSHKITVPNTSISRFTFSLADTFSIKGRKRVNKFADISLSLSFTPRYLEHLDGVRGIRSFILAEYGQDGGFHSIPGVTTKTLFKELGRKRIEEELGLITDDGDEVIGAHNLMWSPENKSKVVSFSCSMCHYGKAAGIVIPGLGTKNASPSAMVSASLRAHKSAKYKFIRGLYKMLHTRDHLAIEKSGEQVALLIARTLLAPGNHNLTQGLTAVNQTSLRFYLDSGTPIPANYPRAPSKAQAMWGIKVKRQYGGAFSDGGADGAYPAWAAGFDLGSAMSNEFILRNLPKLEKIQHHFGQILPPPYPFAIDKAKARRGEAHFEAKCAQCHAANGSYERDENGYPIYLPPKIIPWDKVKTEPERLRLFEGLEKLVSIHPLRDFLKLTPRNNVEKLGYYAPRLVGIWSRFPYLHNGSVPNLMALLTPPEERPVVFSVKRAGEFERFDQKNVGLTVSEDSVEREKLLKLGAHGVQHVYDTRRDEHSNEGHRKGLDLTTDEKYELIEYLKTL